MKVNDYFGTIVLAAYACYFLALFGLNACSHDARRGSGKSEYCFITPKPKWC